MFSADRSLHRRIDLISLQLFVAVCECGSIGKAAEREFITASALSKRLSELEHTLGATLLYRHSRGVSPTPAGESLLHHARSVLLSLERLHGELSEYALGIRGHVRVHASISAIVQFLPEDLGAFAQAHPGIKIDLEENLSTDILRAVSEGAADLGICNTASGVGELQKRSYRQDQLAVVVPAEHALAEEISLPFAATLAYDHVGLHTSSSIHQAMHQAAASVGQTVKLRIRVTGLDAMCRMIANGLGVGVMPLLAFEHLQPSGQLVAIPLADAWSHRPIDLVARDFSALPRTVRLLVDHLCPNASAHGTP